MRKFSMPTPHEQPKSRPRSLLAALSGAVGGVCGGLLIPAGMGLFGPGRDVLGGVLCFGLAGVLPGFVLAMLCVRWVTNDDTLRGFGVMLFSLVVGVTAGLLATLPLALLLEEWFRGLNAIGHS
jgi:hypothetical protein